MDSDHHCKCCHASFHYLSGLTRHLKTKSHALVEMLQPHGYSDSFQGQVPSQLSSMNNHDESDETDSSGIGVCENRDSEEVRLDEDSDSDCSSDCSSAESMSDCSSDSNYDSMSDTYSSSEENDVSVCELLICRAQNAYHCYFYSSLTLFRCIKYG